MTDPQLVDGMIFADIDRDWDIVSRAIKVGVPTMVLNNPTDEPFNCISIDNKTAARNAVMHLLSQGHRRIAHITGDIDTQSGRDRLLGYEEALKESGVGVDKALIKKGGFLRTPARTAAQALLTSDKRPTAIFAASDLMALEVVGVAKTLGFKVPDELSIIGFDNNMTTVESSVHLTTFEQPIADMARLGFENLYQISLGLAKLPVKISLDVKFIKGRTTAAVK